MSVPSLPLGTYVVLSYDYVPDVLERREPYRAAHLGHARAAKERGELLNVGAVGSPPRGALFVFVAEAEPQVDGFVAADPYVAAGLVTSHRVEPWTVVV
jgi:uncharacterized protein